MGRHRKPPSRTEMMLISDIELGPGRRIPKRPDVERLAASMKDIGLRTPITVRYCQDMPSKDGVSDDTCDAYVLVTGGHRLAAAKLLDWEWIECFVIQGDDVKDADVELWEIDENLMRSELDAAEHALLTKRRAAIITAKEEAKSAEVVSTQTGSKLSKRGRKGEGRPKEAASTRDQAAKTGESKSKVARSKKRADLLGAETLRRVTGTSLGTGVELDALCGLSGEAREDLVKRAEAGEKVSARAEAGVIHEKGIPELQEAVTAGKVSVSTASVLATLPKARQVEIMRKGPRGIRAAAKRLMRMRASARAKFLRGEQSESSTSPNPALSIDAGVDIVSVESTKIAARPRQDEEEIAERHAEMPASAVGAAVAPAEDTSGPADEIDQEEEEAENYRELGEAVIDGNAKEACDAILIHLGVDQTKRVVRALNERLRNIKRDCRGCEGTGFALYSSFTACRMPIGQVRLPCDCAKWSSSSSPTTGDFVDGAPADDAPGNHIKAGCAV
jgi:hypothetical protein